MAFNILVPFFLFPLPPFPFGHLDGLPSVTGTPDDPHNPDYLRSCRKPTPTSRPLHDTCEDNSRHYTTRYQNTYT
ncbi:hypothetical protein F4809DRAFT_625057 [Biscogniauxia mediterranea]|nr:hypothetical protein F4809DRAFT_625057 [Biscogniauxia mediterranea]